MILRVIPMICFGFFEDFWRKITKKKTRKSRHIGLLRRSIGKPCRGVDLRCRVGCLTTARPKCQNGTPRVRHGVAKLHCGVATVHSEQISDFCFRTPRICTSIV